MLHSAAESRVDKKSGRDETTKPSPLQPTRHGPNALLAKGTIFASANMCGLTLSTAIFNLPERSVMPMVSAGSNTIVGRIQKSGDCCVHRHASWKGSQVVFLAPSAVATCLLLLAAGLSALLSKSFPHFEHLAVLMSV